MKAWNSTMGPMWVMWVIVRDVIILLKSQLSVPLVMKFSTFILTKGAKEDQVLALKALTIDFALDAIRKWEDL
jgi:hypothetical protein